MWGDTHTLIIKDGDTDTDNMSTAELERKIAELEIKDRVVNDDRKVA